MLRITVQLAAGNAAAAAEAVVSLAACQDADADALRIACCQCVEAQAPAAARQALECLLQRCSSGSLGRASAGDGDGGSPAPGPALTPGFEATVFQNLIRLILVSVLAPRLPTSRRHYQL
jgi:hypothetical protein